MGGLHQGAVGKSDAKAITDRLLVVVRGVEFEAVAGAAGIGNDPGGAEGN